MKDTGNHRKTFADVADRCRALDLPTSATLFQAMPEDLREVLMRSFLSANINSGDVAAVLSYLIRNSDIARLIRAKPSTAMAFEYLYRVKESSKEIDRYFLQSPAGYHVEGRLRALEYHLPQLIMPFLDGRKVLIDNIGSGPGHDMLRVVKNNPDLAEMLHVRNIDPDEDALNIGKQAVSELGLGNTFSFVCKEFQRVRPRNADIILLIGVLCPLPPRTCVKLLKILRRYVRTGGLIIYSTNQVRMLEKDPLTDYLMRLGGWEMDYKTDAESASLAESAGWQLVKQFFDDRERFQCMTVAKR